MTNQSIALIICIILIASGLSYFQYFYKTKKRSATNYILVILRFFTYLTIGILLLNPKIERLTTQIEKRNLVLLVDNSQSIAHLGDTTAVSNLIYDFEANEKIKDQFNFHAYTFGSSVKELKNLDFKDQQTNLTQAFKSASEIFNPNQDIFILISDGNQSYGPDYTIWSKSKKLRVYPFVVGDTLSVLDTKIELVNVNQYSFLNNKFPVEAFVSSTATNNVKTEVELYQNNQLIASKKVNFTSDKSSQQINFQVDANQIGLQNYQLKLKPLTSEKFTENNSFQFGVEIIDESAKVLLASSVLHPDLAMLKRSIESNPQRKVEIKLVGKDKIDIESYEMLIYYQPSSNFKSLMEKAKLKRLGSLLITGEKTDYQFLNTQFDFFNKEITSVNENYYPVLNSDFSSYQVEDLNFDDFPPLSNQFGSLRLKTPFQTLLFQKINGLETTAPLLLTYENGNTKNAILQGENSWRWRSQSFISSNNSFKNFDAFISSLVQYVSSNASKERLLVNTENFIYEGEPNFITAKFYDVNYVFQKDVELRIQLKKQDQKEWQTYPMLYTNNEFSFNTAGLNPGEYDFKVFEEESKITKSGKFNIVSYSVEKQFVGPDLNGLKSLSSSQTVFGLNEIKKVENNLLTNTGLKPIQKSITKKESLIDSLFLFIFLALTLSTEWFIRKYKGLI